MNETVVSGQWSVVSCDQRSATQQRLRGMSQGQEGGLAPAPDELAGSRKECPLCSVDLPLSEFGVCKSRKDGRNLYCKSCIRKKVTASRRELKEYRATRKQRQLNLLAGDAVGGKLIGFKQLSPVEKVLHEIRRGVHRRSEILKATKLSEDELGEALAELLLWTRELTTQLIDNQRHYFLREAAVSEPPASAGGVLPARKPDVRSGFASITGLMPARITGTERKAG